MVKKKNTCQHMRTLDSDMSEECMTQLASGLTYK